MSVHEPAIIHRYPCSNEFDLTPTRLRYIIAMNTKRSLFNGAE